MSFLNLKHNKTWNEIDWKLNFSLPSNILAPKIPKQAAFKIWIQKLFSIFLITPNLVLASIWFSGAKSEKEFIWTETLVAAFLSLSDWRLSSWIWFTVCYLTCCCSVDFSFYFWSRNMPVINLLSRSDLTVSLLIFLNDSSLCSGSNGESVAILLLSVTWSPDVKAWSFWWERRSRYFLERSTCVSLERLIWSPTILQMSSLLTNSS